MTEERTPKNAPGPFHVVKNDAGYGEHLFNEIARDFVEDGIRCLPASDFLAALV